MSVLYLFRWDGCGVSETVTLGQRIVGVEIRFFMERSSVDVILGDDGIMTLESIGQDETETAGDG